jgi:4-hydroxybenzoate polyprenyltransferase
MVMVSFAAALTLCFMQSLYAVVLALCPLLTGVIYSIKVRNFRLKDIIGLRNFRLKDIIGLKSISIGMCWASGAAFLPLTVYSKGLITVCLIFYFFSAGASSIPFYLTFVTKQATVYAG